MCPSMKLFQKKKSLEGFLIELDAKITKNNEDNEAVCLLEKENESPHHDQKTGKKSSLKASSMCKNNRKFKSVNNNNILYTLDTHKSDSNHRSNLSKNADPDRASLLRDGQSSAIAGAGAGEEVPAPYEVNWTTRKKLFVSLMLLGVLAFLAFFLIGTIASLKWFGGEYVEPKPYGMGELKGTVKEKKQHSVGESLLKKAKLLSITNQSVSGQSVTNSSASKQPSSKKMVTTVPRSNQSVSEIKIIKSGADDSDAGKTNVNGNSTNFVVQNAAAKIKAHKHKNTKKTTKMHSHVPFDIPALDSEASSGQTEISPSLSGVDHRTVNSIGPYGMTSVGDGIVQSLTTVIPRLVHSNLYFNLTQMSVPQLGSFLNQLSQDSNADLSQMSVPKLRALSNQISEKSKDDLDLDLTQLSTTQLRELLARLKQTTAKPLT